MAAGLASLEVYQEEGMFEQALELSPYFEEAMHSLKDLPHVIDIRNCGMAAAIELTPVSAAEPLKRVMDVLDRSFDNGLFVRAAGPNIALCPPLIATRRDVDFMTDALKKAIQDSAQAI